MLAYKKEYGCKYLPLFEAKLHSPMQRFLVLLFFITCFAVKAQIQADVFVDGDFSEKRVFTDSLDQVKYINKVMIDWVNEGFYFSGLDSIKFDAEGSEIHLHKGDRTKLNLSGFKGKRVHSYLKKRLDDYSNGGYPFASIRIDSSSLSDGSLTGKFTIREGPEIYYDSAHFFQELKTSHSYIYQLVDMIPNERFSERNYRLAQLKIERSPFLRIERPTDLSFQDKKAKVFLDIKETASSSFRGVVGLQQAQNGNTSAVGTLELDIQNLFRSGKQFKFLWERFAEESQNLNVYYKHPFFLDSKISPSVNFSLLKQDSSFLTRQLNIGIHTYVSPRIELLAEYESTNGTLLSTSLEAVRNLGLADYKRRVYGLQLTKGFLSNLNEYSANYVWNVRASGGTKEIENNLSLPDSFYDTLTTQTSFYRLETTLAYQFKILKRQAIFHHLTMGYIQNDQLLRNELYRLGGLNSVRGFNEKEFFAESYLMSRFEFRSFFENESFVYAFYDHLLYRNGAEGESPFGFGLGFALDTSAGQFRFALATGSSDNQELSFSTLKAHFGYISRF